METKTKNRLIMNTLTTITLVIMFLMAICVIWWLICEIGKRNAKNAANNEVDYEMLHDEIQKDLRRRGDSKHDRDVIRYNLQKLSGMKHKNREKTSLLRDKFSWKYRAIATQRNL